MLASPRTSSQPIQGRIFLFSFSTPKIMSNPPQTKSETETETKKKPCCCKKAKWIRPSELPLYGNPYPPKDVILNREPGPIEEAIRSARLAMMPVYDASLQGLERGQEILDTAIAHSKSTYDLISDETQALPRAIAITSGGLLGLLIASRRGFIKKILYTSLGLTSAAAVCYPKQSQELAELSVYIAKKKGPELVEEYTGIDLRPYIVKSGNGNGQKPKV